jgi:hypothetical protein
VQDEAHESSEQERIASGMMLYGKIAQREEQERESAPSRSDSGAKQGQRPIAEQH